MPGRTCDDAAPVARLRGMPSSARRTSLPRPVTISGRSRRHRWRARAVHMVVMIVAEQDRSMCGRSASRTPGWRTRWTPAHLTGEARWAQTGSVRMLSPCGLHQHGRMADPGDQHRLPVDARGRRARRDRHRRRPFVAFVRGAAEILPEALALRAAGALLAVGIVEVGAVEMVRARPVIEIGAAACREQQRGDEDPAPAHESRRPIPIAARACSASLEATG